MKSIHDIPPHLRVASYLERRLAEEETRKPRGACDCAFKKMTYGGTCSECLKSCIAELKAGKGGGDEYNAPDQPIPDGVYRGCQKRNLQNQDDK